MIPDLAIPSGLTPLGQKAHAAILHFLRRHKLTQTGGCRTFYSPQEWLIRGEKYGINSQLIICHDVGSPGDAFAYERGHYKLIEKMSSDLAALGLYSEQCTVWYSAIHPI